MRNLVTFKQGNVPLILVNEKGYREEKYFAEGTKLIVDAEKLTSHTERLVELELISVRRALPRERDAYPEVKLFPDEVPNPDEEGGEE